MIRTLSALIVAASVVQFAVAVSDSGASPWANTAPDSGAENRAVASEIPTESVFQSSQLTDARHRLREASATLASSAGRVQDDEVRAALRRDLAAASTTLTILAGIDPIASGRWPDSEGAPNRPTTQTVRRVSLGLLLEQLATVNRDESAVNAAVAQWTTVENQRAAAAAAVRVSPLPYSETVWASGFQAQIDACRGAVNLTATYGVAVIGEHWHCGGSRFPHTGALVQLTGTMTGLYRVGAVVAVLDAYSQTAADIPRGPFLLYQTCRNGNAHTETFTQLIPERS